MDEGLKRRLIGATVLVSLAVIFVPMLLEHDPEQQQGITDSTVPPRPPQDFSSRILPLEAPRPSAPSQVRPDPVSRSQPVEEAAPVAPAEPVQPPPEVEPEEARVGLSAWVIQVGSFSNRENADSLISELREKGFPAFIEQAEVSGKQLFRVRVGPEVDKVRAEALLADLDRALESKKLKGSLKRYP